MTTKDKLNVIESYYKGCSTGDIEAMVATLDDEVTHFFLAPNPGDSPVSGSEHLARYWRKVQDGINGHWVVDHIIGEENEAVIEWTLYWTAPDGERLATRGAEWYRFREGVIREIRAYYQQPVRTSELRDFDYSARDYSRLGNENGRPKPLSNESVA